VKVLPEASLVAAMVILTVFGKTEGADLDELLVSCLNQLRPIHYGVKVMETVQYAQA